MNLRDALAIPARDITDEAVYRDRRRVLAALGLLPALGVAGCSEAAPPPSNVVVTPETAPEALPVLSGFTVAPRANGAFAVTYRTGESSVEQVLMAVRAAGVTIKDIATEDPDLEDVFLAMTYGDATRPSPTQD